MKIFGFGKDKSVQKLDKPDTSGLENLGRKNPKLNSEISLVMINHTMN